MPEGGGGGEERERKREREREGEEREYFNFSPPLHVEMATSKNCKKQGIFTMHQNINAQKF